MKSEEKIITYEGISIDIKDEKWIDVERCSSINIKLRTKKIINKQDTMVRFNIGIVSKCSSEEDFGTGSNQTFNLLSF